MRRLLEVCTWLAAWLGWLALLLGPADSPRAPAEQAAMARPVAGSRVCAVLSDERGAALPGASFFVFSARDDGRFVRAGEATMDAAGSPACVGEVPPGRAWLLAEAPGRARASTDLVLPVTEPVRLSLGPEQRLSVLVVDELGDAVSRATLLVDTSDPLPFGALTDVTGAAAIARLPAGPWTVRAHAPGFESALAENVQRDLRLVLRRLSGIDVLVVDAAGAPAPGASVVIGGASLWPARRAETGPDGLARLRALSAGSYDLRASRGPLVSSTLHGFELARGAREKLTLELAPGRLITALVTDGDGESAPSVAGADVILAEGGLASFPHHGRTDRHGKVTLGPIAPGPATLSARADEFVGGPLVVVPDAPAGPVRVPLVRGGRLRGTVVDDRGFPVEGAAIEVIGTDRYGLPIAETPLTTQYRAVHFEWSLGGPRPLIPAGELGVMPGPVPPIPRAGSFVAAVPPSTDVPAVSAPSPWISDAGGEFDARPITPGRVRALVRHPGYVETASELVAVASGGEATVKVVLLRGGAVAGRVVDERGFPVEDAAVSLIAERGTYDRHAASQRDGSFEFDAVPHAVTLAVARPEEPGRNVLTRGVEVAEGGRVEVELVLPAPRQAVRLTVTDASGAAVDLAEVRVLSLAPEVPLRKTLFTSEDGGAEIPDAAGLPLRLLIDAPGFAAVERVLEAAPVELSLPLAAGVLVTGRVTAVRGRIGVENAIVTLRGGVQRRSTSSDADGGFRFESVAPGPVEIRVAHPEYAEVVVGFEVESTGRSDRPFELSPIDLEEPGSVEGRVVDADGEPVDGARVSVGFAPTYLPEGALPYGMALSDARGEFVLRGVRPGVQRLSAYAPGVGRGTVDAVEVTSGRAAAGVVLRLTDPSEDGEPFASGGLAITLGERRDGERLELVVVDVAAGSEAERGGLRRGDVLLAIDGQAPTAMAEGRARLAGRAGTDVVLELTRDGAPLKLRITRQAVRR